MCRRCVGRLHRGDLHCQSPTWDWVTGPGDAGSRPAGLGDIFAVKSYPQFSYISTCNKLGHDYIYSMSIRS